MRLTFASEVPKVNRYSSPTKDRGIEVSRSLIFAVGNESAKTAKIWRYTVLIGKGQ